MGLIQKFTKSNIYNKCRYTIDFNRNAKYMYLLIEQFRIQYN